MTLYVDTSSLVKLYVTEAGSDVVRQLVGDANVVATSVVAYVETRAAEADANSRTPEMIGQPSGS